MACLNIHAEALRHKSIDSILKAFIFGPLKNSH